MDAMSEHQKGVIVARNGAWFSFGVLLVFLGLAKFMF